MDGKNVSMALLILAACLCMVANAMSLPVADHSNDIERGPKTDELDERATWLDTRGLEEDFKELVFLAIQELENEGRINPVVNEQNTKSKRGRWQGFCFRRTRNGRFLPYICWKGDRK